jgi:uncharacterized protein (TIGR02246 family)
MTIARVPVTVLAALILLAIATPSHSHTHAMSSARRSSDQEVRTLYERWTKALEARDLDGVMWCYAPGDAVVAYDIVPPLQYRGVAAYRKDYRAFFDQYDGPLHVEYRDLRVMSSGDLAVFQALERITGRLKSGERSDIWLRATSVARRIGGRWRIVQHRLTERRNTTLYRPWRVRAGSRDSG